MEAARLSGFHFSEKEKYKSSKKNKIALQYNRKKGVVLFLRDFRQE